MATYDELLALDNKLKTHQSHLQFLATEVYKSKNKLNPSFIWKTHQEKYIPYSRRRSTSLLNPNVNAWKYGTHLAKFRDSVLWNNLPIKFKKFKFLQKYTLLLKQGESLRVKYKEF